MPSRVLSPSNESKHAGDYANGTRVSGTITSPVITGIDSTASLAFKHFRQVEKASGTFDSTTVEIVNGATSTTVWTRTSANASTPSWTDSGAISLAAFAGKSIQIRFRFDSKDSVANAFRAG